MKNTKIILFIFLIGVSIVLFSLTEPAKATKEKVHPDYTPMYEKLLNKISDNYKLVKADEKLLSDTPNLSKEQILDIKRRINLANTNISLLNQQVHNIKEQSNEAYQLDPKTQKKFNDAILKIKTDYFGKYGVHQLFEDVKERKIIVYVDVGIFNNSNYPTTMADLFGEISNSIDNVNIVVVKAAYTLDFSYPTYVMPLNKQVENNINQLYCINKNHILVIRPNMNYSCITVQSNEIVQWTPATFGFNGEKRFRNIVPLQADEEGNLVSYWGTNGFISDWYYSKTNSIHFNINTIDDGSITLSIKPQSFDKNYSDLIVLDNLEEISHTQTIQNGTITISFDFTHPNPVIEMVIPSYSP